MAETKNFAIVRSMFGSHWIGMTKLPVNDTSIFADFDDALDAAQSVATGEDLAEMEVAFDNEEIEDIEESVEKFII